MNSPAISTAGGLRQQDRRALIAGALLLILMLGYARILKPGVDRMFADRIKLHEQRELLVREAGLVQNISQLSSQRTATLKALEKESPRLFDGDSVGATAALASYVTELARVSQVRLTSVEAHAPRTAQGVTTLGVDLHGEGNWRNVLAFIRSLETATKLVDVQSLRLERGPRGGPLGGDAIVISATTAGYSRSAP